MASVRLVSIIVCGAAALALAACGGGDGGGGRTDSGGADGGGPPGDSGPPVDTGPPVDSGTSDGGGGGRMCGHHAGECDVIAQDCPMPTDGCYFGASEPGGTPSTICVEAGLATRGMPCTALNSCQEGLFCDAGSDTCAEYCCEGSVADCGAGEICLSFSDPSWLGICRTPGTCTVVPQDGCEAGQGCYPISSDGTVGCVSAGTTPEGGACEFLNECMPGFLCVGTDGSPTRCARACRVSLGMEDCGGTAMCGGLMGLGDLGACPLP